MDGLTVEEEYKVIKSLLFEHLREMIPGGLIDKGKFPMIKDLIDRFERIAVDKALDFYLNYWEDDMIQRDDWE